MSVRCSNTYLIEDGSEKRHLYVVISNPANEPFVLVNVTTTNAKSDRSCILRPGDHAFIKHESCIAYRHAVQTTAAKLLALIREGAASQDSQMPETVMHRIWLGARRSKDLINNIRAVLTQQGLIPPTLWV